MGRAALIVNGVAYVAVLAYAIWAGWKSATFVWTLWLSGVVGVVIPAALSPFFAIPEELAAQSKDAGAVKALRVIGAAFGGAFLETILATVVLVPLALGSLGTVLNAFEPLLPSGVLSARGGGWFNAWVLFLEAGQRYWPFAAVLCGLRFLTVYAASGRPKLHSFLDNVTVIEFFRAFVVVALALLVHIALGSWSKTAATMVNYLLLAAFLFPWRIFIRFSAPPAKESP